MEATAKMKNGEGCDLLERLAAEEQFNLSEEDIQEIMRPELYIGRCVQQVDAFLAKINPLIEGIAKGSAEIGL